MAGAFDLAAERTPTSPDAAARPDSPPSPTAVADAAEGAARLGEYLLAEKLAEGGVGAVYRAVHTILGRTVAVKILGHLHAADSEAQARFEREMRALGGIDHPHIVRALDARQLGGVRFLVMEYLEGLDLRALQQRSTTLAVADACEIARQAALGLQCAADHGLVHRDIKPSNLMLTRAGIVKILDLGLARLVAAEDHELTAVNQVLGTLDFMAPEQITDSHRADIRADIYSLGCTLYKLLAGTPPFGGPQYGRPVEKIYAHLRAAPEPLEQHCPEIPRALSAAVSRMLAKSPDQRFATPRQVAEVLRPFSWGADLPALVNAAGVPAAESGQAHAGSTHQLSPQAITLLHVPPPG